MFVSRTRYDINFLVLLSTYRADRHIECIGTYRKVRKEFISMRCGLKSQRN